MVDAENRLTDVTDVIRAATALKLELETSLSAWKAAAAVLEAPTVALADKIETAADEVRKAPGGRPWGTKKKANEILTRFANGTEWNIETVSAVTGKTVSEILNMSDEEFTVFTADPRPGKSKLSEPNTLELDDAERSAVEALR